MDAARFDRPAARLDAPAHPDAHARADGPARDDYPPDAELRRLVAAARLLCALLLTVLVLDRGAESPSAAVFLVVAFDLYAVLIPFAARRLRHGVDAAVLCLGDTLWLVLMQNINLAVRDVAVVLLLFPIMVCAASFGVFWGSMLTVLASAATFLRLTLASDFARPAEATAISAMLLSVGLFACALSRRGGQLRNRMRLIAEINAAVARRRSIEDVAEVVLERLSKALEADVGILSAGTGAADARMYRLRQGSPLLEICPLEAGAIGAGEAHAPAMAGAAPAGQRGRRAGLLPSLFAGMLGLDEPGARSPTLAEPACVKSLLGRRHMLHMALSAHGQLHGWLALGRDGEPFSGADAELAGHVLRQIGAALENALLIERLAADAAHIERARIGRDLHDSAIQPYVGLKFAVEALARSVGADHPVSRDLARLVDITKRELALLRELVGGLRSGSPVGEDSLGAAVRRQASRYGELFGIRVQVSTEGEVVASRRIAAEVFHMVSEGLSNIRRHSDAGNALIVLACENGMLHLDIANDGALRAGIPSGFLPQSLAERASALGGRISVQRGPGAGPGWQTRVRIAIPAQLGERS